MNKFLVTFEDGSTETVTADTFNWFQEIVTFQDVGIAQQQWGPEHVVRNVAAFKNVMSIKKDDES